MSKRAEAAVARAGALDRIEAHLTAANQALGNAVRELAEIGEWPPVYPAVSDTSNAKTLTEAALRAIGRL